MSELQIWVAMYLAVGLLLERQYQLSLGRAVLTIVAWPVLAVIEILTIT